MNELTYTNAKYTTPVRKISPLARLFPSLHFYCRFVGIVFRCSRLAKAGVYDDDKWAASSHEVLHYLEDVGVRIHISGIEHISSLQGPCVIVGNHMSFLETLLLPIIIVPKRKMTYVIKESLLEYPVFKHIMRSRNPIAVSRTNPRQDLKVVMAEGVKRIQDGISVMVFPQTTRSHSFDPRQMSSIGVKLAKKAGVPIVPLALKTDALQNGAYLKDFGRIDRTRDVYFAFDAPLQVNGRGDEEQQAVNAFIERNIRQWSSDLVVGEQGRQ